MNRPFRTWLTRAVPSGILTHNRTEQSRNSGRAIRKLRMSNRETPNEAAMGVETADKMESLYQERLKRYVTAMRNEKPDMIPIRPFVAEFTAKYAGYTSQEVSYDYEKAFTAAREWPPNSTGMRWSAIWSTAGWLW